MPKYTPEERQTLAAAGRRLGLGKRDKKIVDLREKKAKATVRPEPEKKPRGYRESEIERRDRIIRDHKLKHLKRSDIEDDYNVKDPTRYPEVVMWNAGNKMLDNILRRYKYIMKPQGITPAEFRLWRESFMLMNPEELGALVRVPAQTIKAWENGSEPIPFSMWWVMHTTMQDPEYFLTRPGFHDFYIEHVDGIPYLCSHSWPDIRCTPTDLYVNRSALNDVLSLREEIKQREEKLIELTQENTRLRQLLKVEGVTAELQMMHDHIGKLMQKIHTADVMPLQPLEQVAAVLNPISKAA